MITTSDTVITQTVESSFVRRIDESGSLEGLNVEKYITLVPDNGKARVDFGWWGAHDWPERLDLGPIPEEDLKHYSYSIDTRPYGRAKTVDAKTLRRDLTGQLASGYGTVLADLTRSFHRKLFFDLLIAGNAGTDGLAYDGEFFFDTDHADAVTGDQSNMIQVDIVDPANPTNAEWTTALATLRRTLASRKQDRGRPAGIAMGGGTIVVNPQHGAQLAQILNLNGSAGGAQILPGDLLPVGTSGLWRGQPWVEDPLWTPTDEFLWIREASPSAIGPVIMRMEVPWHTKTWAPEDLPHLFGRDVYYSAYRAELRMRFGWWRHAVRVKFI